MRLHLIALSVVLLGAGGCASHPKQEVRPGTEPLPLDPTQPSQLAEWWGDGKGLLFLDPSGTYRLFDGTDRYREPAERGRWWQQSYATLWLEPYERQGAHSTRVVIRKEDGRLEMDVPGAGTLQPLEGPPPVIEDRLIGEWSGAGGELRLGQDLRYRFAPRSTAAATAALAGQRGDWMVEEDVILLTPDSAGLQPVMVRIRGQQEEKIVLESPEGALERSQAIPDRG